jgi:hypothetical protein
VHSLSQEKPLKVAGFRVRDATFEGAQKYSEWMFVHALPARPAPKPGAPPKTPASVSRD